MLDEHGAILTTQWSLLLNGRRLDHRSTVAAAHIEDLSILNLQHVHASAAVEAEEEQGYSKNSTTHFSGPHAFALAVQTSLNHIVSTTCLTQADMPANHSMFDSKTCLDSEQVIKNIKAQLSKELVVCSTLGQSWQSSNSHLISMLSDLQSILRVQRPIHSACRQLAKIRSTSTDGYTMLKYLKWVTSRVAISWARHLTSDFCCTLQPSYAFLSRQTEQTAYQLTVSPEGITVVDLPGMYGIAVQGEARVAELWMLLAQRRADVQLHGWLLEAVRPHILRPGRMRSFVLALRSAWISQREQDWVSVKAKAMRAGLLPPPKSQKIENTYQLLAFNTELAVLTEVTAQGKHAVPSISMRRWHDAATNLVESLGMECSSVTKLMHPEGSSFKPDSPWVLVTVTQPCSDIPRCSQTAPRHWAWLPNEDAADELVVHDGARVERSTEYLLEQALDSDSEAEDASLQDQSLAANLDWSPIAAHQVDQARHPLEQYEQALQRHHQGSESHAAWRSRITAKHPDHYPQPAHSRSGERTRACVTREMVRYQPEAPGSPSDDYSDSSEPEATPGLQIALLPSVPIHRRPTQQLADFHNSLPEELRLPTAAQIASTRAARTKQTTLAFKVAQDFRPGR
jgi:hypothetical protein